MPKISVTILLSGAQVQPDKILEKVFSQIKANGLKINIEKCIFSVDQIGFSGHILTSHGIAPN